MEKEKALFTAITQKNEFTRENILKNEKFNGHYVMEIKHQERNYCKTYLAQSLIYAPHIVPKLLQLGSNPNQVSFHTINDGAKLPIEIAFDRQDLESFVQLAWIIDNNSLNLISSARKENAIRQLVNFIQTVPQNAIFCSAAIGNFGVRVIAYLLKQKAKQIEELVLEDCDISEVDSLCQIISSQPKLIKLNLSKNSQLSKKMSFLMAECAHHEKLKLMIFSHIVLPDDAVKVCIANEV